MDGCAVRHAASIRRLPLTIANTYRVLAFRTTITIGPFDLDLAEVSLTVAYIASLFVWSFINSSHHSVPLSHVNSWPRIATSLDRTKLNYVYYVIRVANIACSQLPLVTALGTKNNIVGSKPCFFIYLLRR